MEEVPPEVEVRELRALVALLEKERTDLVHQMDDLEEELNHERRGAAGLDAELTRLREKDMFVSSPMVRIDEGETDMLRQRLDEALVVREDLEARLDSAEHDEAHTIAKLDEKTARIGTLASRLATIEVDHTRLVKENQELADELSARSQHHNSNEVAALRQQIALLELRCTEAERRGDAAQAEVITLTTGLAEARLHSELSVRDSPIEASLESNLPGLSAQDPLIPSSESLHDLPLSQLSSLDSQYGARIRHLSSLQKDVQRALHSEAPGQYEDPDKSEEKSGELEEVEVEWLELAHWMRSRFGRQTSQKELRAYVARFAPRKLRAPECDSPSSSTGRPSVGWRGHNAEGRSGGGSAWGGGGGGGGGGGAADTDRELFERLFNEARLKGRALYAADREYHSARTGQTSTHSYSHSSSPSRSFYSARHGS